MRTLVMPAFEHFTLREISISKIGRFLKGQAKISYSRAKHAKVDINLAFGLALRCEAIVRNAVLGTARLRCPPSTVNSLTISQVRPSGRQSARGNAGEGCPARSRTVSWKPSSR
ncbi:hypothetical protein [Aeromicrobium sp.]|uniref:hypothetical protein n=1 Tax=Aeromicrobium sp. TaxID=1871063 RepID=UPI001989703E|nr:hypothetical protein [Aeromicrobium sp.]MBC7630707.1 hypothetical protein [Aeromicrobium sp.]